MSMCFADINDVECAVKSINVIYSQALDCTNLCYQNIVLGDPAFYVIIAMLFNAMLKHGKVPLLVFDLEFFCLLLRTHTNNFTTLQTIGYMQK